MSHMYLCMFAWVYAHMHACMYTCMSVFTYTYMKKGILASVHVCRPAKSLPYSLGSLKSTLWILANEHCQPIKQVKILIFIFF